MFEEGRVVAEARGIDESEGEEWKAIQNDVTYARQTNGLLCPRSFSRMDGSLRKSHKERHRGALPGDRRNP